MVFDPRSQVWTIANGQTVSDAIDKLSEDLVGFKLPATMTGATVSFQVSDDDVDGAGTYQALSWEGTVVSFATASAQSVSIDPSKFAGWRWIKIVSGTAEGAERTIVPKFRRYG
jgi:hypothetical protein